MVMEGDENSTEEADIQVGPSDDEEKGLKGGAKKALAMPSATVNRLRVRYKHMNKRDKFAVLLFVLVVVMVIVIMSIWTTGGGIGGPDLGPEIRPPSDWNMESLEEVEVAGEEENTNLEGQETPYLAPLNPAPGEIYFVTNLFIQVDWTDESTPPTQAP
ncbi:MAG: hypothetical protein GWN12_10725, partial [Thermoplasmata archaeon]|nr:hypothetical protein [Thermoplasmata archaeon]NIW89231.1 hypothetical protein [Thermoplasmata archaeon]